MFAGAGRAGEGERTVITVLAGAGVGVGVCGQVQGRAETTGSVGTSASTTPLPPLTHSFTCLDGGEERESSALQSAVSAHRRIFTLIEFKII